MWVWGSLLLLTIYMCLGELLNLSEPQFPDLKNGLIALILLGCYRDYFGPHIQFTSQNLDLLLSSLYWSLQPTCVLCVWVDCSAFHTMFSGVVLISTWKSNSLLPTEHWGTVLLTSPPLHPDPPWSRVTAIFCFSYLSLLFRSSNSWLKLYLILLLIGNFWPSVGSRP